MGELEFYLFKIIFKICLRLHRFAVMMNLKTNKRKKETAETNHKIRNEEKKT